jgi:DNA-binding NarL/FixJ family response regulator
MTIRVLVADDQPLVSAGICALLDAEPDIEVVAQTVLAEVVVAAGIHCPDVVVMDLPPEGTEIIGKTVACGALRVLVLTAQHTARLVCDALLAGASGYLLKATATDTLVGVVHAIASTGTWLDPAVVTDLLLELTRQPVSGGNSSAVVHRLTPREQEILVLMAHGLSNAEMANQLFISSLTVRTHVGRVLAKLGARNRAHAVTTAYRVGLVRVPLVA